MESLVDQALVARLEEAAKGLIARSDRDAVEGDDIAREVGREPSDPAVYKAFLEIERQGTLKLSSWGGALNLPHAVELPADD